MDKVTAITGDILTYTTVITNNGNVPLSNVIFTDTLPVGTSFVPGSVTLNGVPQPLLSPNPPGFSIGNIPSGVSVTVTFRVTVTVVPIPPVFPVLTNTSIIDYQYQIDPNLPPLNGTTTGNPVVTEVILGELAAVKSVDKAFATVGDTLTYNVVITNTGDVTATNVFFTDAPPAGTSFVPGSVIIGGVPQPGLNPSTGFNLGSVSPGSSVIVIFEVRIVLALSLSIIINQAQVTFNFQVDPGRPPVVGSAISNPVQTTIQDIKESVCVVVQKVYSACQQRECFPTFTVDLPTTGAPFTFVSIAFDNGVIVGSPIFTPIPSRPNFSRAQFTVRIPFVLMLSNAINETIQLSGDLPDIQKDIVVYLPPSRSEFELNLLVETRTQLLTYPTFSEASIQLAIGSFIITKVTGIVQLLIPAFGYCPEPCACEDYVPEDLNSCRVFTDTTLTPFPNDFFPPQLDVSCSGKY
ncbi:putative internalin [Desulfosporosinus sp. I2]|nr:putative internalin [Desulfosporosinus sp. I2]